MLLSKRKLQTQLHHTCDTVKRCPVILGRGDTQKWTWHYWRVHPALSNQCVVFFIQKSRNRIVPLWRSKLVLFAGRSSNMLEVLSAMFLLTSLYRKLWDFYFVPLGTNNYLAEVTNSIYWGSSHDNNLTLIIMKPKVNLNVYQTDRATIDFCC